MIWFFHSARYIDLYAHKQSNIELRDETLKNNLVLDQNIPKLYYTSPDISSVDDYYACSTVHFALIL